MVQLHLTVPHQQQGPALSRLREAKDLYAYRDRPSLRGGVTLGDRSNGQGLFFTSEPCLRGL